MGKLTISMAIFNSYVKLPEGIQYNDKIQPESVVFWGSTDSNLASYSTDEEWSMVVPYLGLWVEPPTSQHSNLCGKVEVEGSLKSEMFDAQ